MQKPKPEEFVAEVRRLTEVEGLSAAQVAVRMGTTRNAVTGLWRRHEMRPVFKRHMRMDQGRGRQQPSLPPILDRLPKYED